MLLSLPRPCCPLDRSAASSYCAPILTGCRALAASIARKIYLRSGTGVGGFRKVYGGNKNKGTRKEKFQKASGGMIRHILTELEKANMIEKCPDGCVCACFVPCSLDAACLLLRRTASLATMRTEARPNKGLPDASVGSLQRTENHEEWAEGPRFGSQWSDWASFRVVNNLLRIG